MTSPSPQSADLLSCCADVYSHPAALWLLGESFHPGGLDLTTRVGEVLGLGAGMRLLDVGSGRGASAAHLAATTGCSVLGLTLEEAGAVAGRDTAQSRGIAESVAFEVTSLERWNRGAAVFDAAIMECVLSIMPSKVEAVRSIAEALTAGGHIGVTDVTLEDELPEELRGVYASVGCVGDALPLDGYREVLAQAGLTVERAESLPEVAGDFLRGIKGKLLLAEIAAKLGKIPVEPAAITTARSYLDQAIDLVANGRLGYALFVARK